MDVTTCGAIGDGATDDTAAFATAISTAGDGKVYVPAGTYRVGSLDLTELSDIIIEGDGNRTVLLPDTTEVWLDLCGSSKITIRDVKIAQYGSVVPSVLFLWCWVSGLVERLSFVNVDIGIPASKGLLSACGFLELLISGCHWNQTGNGSALQGYAYADLSGAIYLASSNRLGMASQNVTINSAVGVAGNLTIERSRILDQGANNAVIILDQAGSVAIRDSLLGGKGKANLVIFNYSELITIDNTAFVAADGSADSVDCWIVGGGDLASPFVGTVTLTNPFFSVAAVAEIGLVRGGIQRLKMITTNDGGDTGDEPLIKQLDGAQVGQQALRDSDIFCQGKAIIVGNGLGSDCLLRAAGTVTCLFGADNSSRLGEWTAPPAPPPDPENYVAVDLTGATVTASSTYAGYDPMNIIDEITTISGTNGWCSADQTGDQSLVLHLAAAAVLTRVDIWPGQTAAGQYAKTVVISASTDGQNYTSKASVVLADNGAIETIQSILFENATAYAYWKFTLPDNYVGSNIRSVAEIIPYVSE